MSDVTQLLKLAEEKKKAEAKPNLEHFSNENIHEGVSKSKHERVSKEAQKLRVETSPIRNFTKVSNSITKNAIPEKYFRGLSKHTYDVLYQRTRGAIIPARTIQLTKDELVRLTGLSKDAVKLHIRYLKDSGLLQSRQTIGSHAGWEYEVFVPEELDGVTLGKGGEVSVSMRGENLRLHSVQNLLTLAHTNTVDNKELNDVPNTSLKTNTTDDDSALAKFAATMNEISRRLTNKNLNKKDVDIWDELAKLLATELELAAVRTGAISNVPAFLCEHLRRKLAAKPGKSKSSNTRPIEADTNSDLIIEEPEPLSEQGREAVLKTMRELLENGQRDFLVDFEGTYTADDWKYLTEQLGN